MALFLLRTTLVFAAFCGMAFLGYGLRTAIAPGKQEAIGADLTVICQKCGNMEVARVRQLHACFCSKCGNPVSEAWRCLDCRKVFPFLMRMPKNRAVGRKGLEDWAVMHRCPHCQSMRTEPVRIDGDKGSADTQDAARLPRPTKQADPPRPIPIPVPRP